MRDGDGTPGADGWRERERRRQEAVQRARRMPREAASVTSRLVLWLALAAWAGVFLWLALSLPDRVPTHWSRSGVPDGWSSRTGALALFAGFLLMTLPLVLLSRLVLLAPDLVNAPHREWWTSTPRRVLRFERLVREDLMVVVALTLLLLVSTGLVMGYAAGQPTGAAPGWSFWVVLVTYLVVLTLLVLRMYRSRRYRPDAQGRALQDEER